MTNPPDVLAAGVDAVLALHRESACEEGCCGAQPCCAECGPAWGWPCPTVQALIDAGVEVEG